MAPGATEVQRGKVTCVSLCVVRRFEMDPSTSVCLGEEAEEQPVVLVLCFLLEQITGGVHCDVPRAGCGAFAVVEGPRRFAVAVLLIVQD